MQEELPYSHFNEMFVKPLESLLSLDLCNGDVQDQVSSVINLHLIFTTKKLTLM